MILLDEPFNGLDKDGIDLVQNLIESKRNDQTVIVLSCHNDMEMMGLVDEVATMSAGSLKWE